MRVGGGPCHRARPGRRLPVTQRAMPRCVRVSRGWVTNRPDGRVEAWVEGETDPLECGGRRRGPVENVQVDAKAHVRHHIRAHGPQTAHSPRPRLPKPGILFYDITTLLRDPVGLKTTIDQLSAPYAGNGIDVVVGIESRGFILGAAVAERLGAGFIPIRKPGKLPAKSIKETYDLEYRKDALEIHADAVETGAARADRGRRAGHRRDRRGGGGPGQEARGPATRAGIPDRAAVPQREGEAHRGAGVFRRAVLDPTESNSGLPMVTGAGKP